MRALEFTSKINNNQITIPNTIQSELKTKQVKTVRVIVLIDESDTDDNQTFKKTAQDKFLAGYSDSDSIYDNY